MISYNLHAFLAVTILALVHMYAGQMPLKKTLWHTRFLSMSGGIAVAYVFVELLPKLGVSQATLQSISTDMIPLKERHVYMMAFFGFLFFYGMHRLSSSELKNQDRILFPLNMGSYIFLNFLVGYEIVDIHDPFIQPLYLFTLALGLHYFILDRSLRLKHPVTYENVGRYLLSIALFLGFIIGLMTELPKTTIIYGVAFIAGGMILNVLSYELPQEQKSQSYLYFAFGGILYSLILVYE